MSRGCVEVRGTAGTCSRLLEASRGSVELAVAFTADPVATPDSEGLELDANRLFFGGKGERGSPWGARGGRTGPR